MAKGRPGERAALAHRRKSLKPVPSGPAGRAEPVDTAVGIQDLSTEVLLQVFRLYIGVNDHNSLEPSSNPSPCIGVDREGLANPFTLSCVCKSWRRIMLSGTRSESSLWSTLYIDCPRTTQLPKLAKWLRRSNGQPLGITLILDGRPNKRAQRKAMKMVFKEMHRWTNVRISLHYTMMYALFSQQWPVPEILEIFTVDISSWTDHETSYLRSMLYSAPRLRQVTWGSTIHHRVLDGAPWESLTSLELYDCSAAYLLPLLATHGQKLEHLKVGFLVGDPSDDCPVVHLPNLQGLSLHWVSTPEILVYLSLPSLTALLISSWVFNGSESSGGIHSGTGALVRLCERSQFKLRSFELSWPIYHEAAWGLEQDVLTVLRRPQFSSLAHLSLGCRTTNDTVSALTVSSGSCLLPQLGSVELMDCDCSDEIFLEMTTSRQAVVYGGSVRL